MALYVDNAISWAQWRLRGGWKNLLIVTACYAAAEIFFISLSYQLTDGQRNKLGVLEASSLILLAVQVVMLLPFAAMAVTNSLRRDLTTRLIESHRLMPMSPAQAIVGYLVGSPLQAMSLALINLVVGAVLTQMRSLPVDRWFIANGVLLAFSASLWTVMLMLSFVSRVVFAVLIALVFGILFSGGYILIVLPGLLAFCSPLHSKTIFQYASIDPVTIGTVAALFAQFLVAVLCIRAAARKYADGYAVGLTLGPALAALGIWSGLTWVGITYFRDLRTDGLLEYREIDWRVLVVGAISSCLLVALLPLAAAAWGDIHRKENAAGGEKRSNKPWSLFTCLCVCLLFVLAPLSAKIDANIYYRWQPYSYYIAPQPAPTARGPSRNVPMQRQWVPRENPPLTETSVPILVRGRANPAMIVAACAIFLVEMYLLMRLFYPRLKRANVMILLMVAFLWFVPLLADVFYYGAKEEEAKLDLFGPYSPIGTIANALDRPAKGAWLGVAGQAVLCGIVAILVATVGRRKRASPPPLPIGLGENL